MYSCTCACVCTVRAQNYASIIIVNSRPSSSCCSKYQLDSYWHPFVEQMSECTVLSKVWCWSRHSPKPPLNPQSWANDTEQSFHVSYPNVPNWQACSRAGDGGSEFLPTRSGFRSQLCRLSSHVKTLRTLLSFRGQMCSFRREVHRTNKRLKECSPEGPQILSLMGWKDPFLMKTWT